MTAFLAGAMLGVTGSGHCMLMCGPLAVAIGRTLRRPTPVEVWRQAALYHLGRAGGYMLVAVPVGLLSEALTISGFGRALSIATGLMLLASLVSALPGSPRPRGRWVSETVGRACGAAFRLQRTHPIAGPLAAGAANGLLPCGLVYTAIAAAAGIGSAADSIALLAGFWAGTLPMLIGVGMTTHALPSALREPLRKLAPIAVALVAVLLIFRGVVPQSPHSQPHLSGHSSGAPAHR